MRLSSRLRTLCGELSSCSVLADVGCDHGYCTLYALENGVCGRAYISDVSAGSLRKAEKLLARYIEEGRVRSFCCDGLSLVPRDAEQVLVAGMGGDEILSVLGGGFLPPRLVLQPMKNAPKVRAFLLGSGYSVVRDYTFRDAKFYDVIVAQKGAPVREYDERSLRFGYDNLHSPSQDFLAWLRAEAEKWRSRTGGGEAAARRLKELTEAYDEAQRNLR